MKILTEKQLVEIQNQTLNKIYQALRKLHERDNSDESGAVRCNSNFNMRFFPKKHA